MPKWSTEEDNYLISAWGYLPPSQIAADLKRTKNSIIGRAWRLKLNREKADVKEQEYA